MLHHVGIEVTPADLERSVEFWQTLGFVLVEPPATLAEFTWLERGGTQVHLMPTDDPVVPARDDPVVPARGHTAIVAPDFDRTVARLRERGFEVEARREHWGSPRALAIAPGDHRVELMESPPLGV